jgi:hypothetical protein
MKHSSGRADAMTTAAPEDRSIPANTTDAIRIVPLHVDPAVLRPLDDTVGPAATPQLTYRGGHLLTSVKVFTVFWGAAWEQQPVAGTLDQINRFFDTILTSELIDQLAEYSVPGQQIGNGSRIGTTTIATPAPPAAVTDAQIRSFLQQEITAGTLPAADAQTLYFVYTPPGVVVVQGGSRSCQAFCGYHDNVNAQLFYAVMPYPGCSGCTGTLATFDALTTTSSHELCEAVTDAVPGQGWYDDVNGEIGDICAWMTKTVAGYTVQQEWSNAAGACS